MRGSNGGPKSKAGKAAVTRNPLKHGIMSPHPVIFEGIETEAAWQRFYETDILNHQVIKTETDLATADAYLDGTLSTGELPELDPAYVAAHQQTRVIPYGDALDKITRYEAHLHRLWVQTSHELEARQARRRGERTHLARLDISSAPAG
jgi:hypothetical protein